MRKSILTAVLLIASLLTPSMVKAQSVLENPVSLNPWETVKFSYSPTTLELIGEEMDFKGFSFEYMKGQNIVDNKPIFLEYGIGAEILNYTDEYSEYYDGYRISAETKTTIADIYIPVNLGYKVALNGGTNIMPYVGIKAQYNLLGQSTLEYSVDGYSESEEIDLFSKSDMDGETMKRTWVSWHIGATIEMNKWSIGIRYGKCFSDEIINHIDDCELTSTTISVGIFF